MQPATPTPRSVDWKTNLIGLLSGGSVTPDVLVPLLDDSAVAEAAAEMFVAAANSAVTRRGRFVVALAGGSTPRRLYGMLAAEPYRSQVPWESTTIIFGDERCVPAEHEASNYRMARETLLDALDLPREQVHPIGGHLANPSRAALFYENDLRALYPGEEWPRIDLALLGVGADGHTASLFPGTDALAVDDRWACANYVPQLENWRITLTLPVLQRAELALFLITGADKAPVVAEAFGGRPHEAPHPCELVQPLDGDREVLLDLAAASQL